MYWVMITEATEEWNGTTWVNYREIVHNNAYATYEGAVSYLEDTFKMKPSEELATTWIDYDGRVGTIIKK